MSLSEYSLSEYSLPDSSPSLRGGVKRRGCGLFRGASSSRSSPLATLFSISLNLLSTEEALHSFAACIRSMFASDLISLLWSSSFSIQLSFSFPINSFGSFGLSSVSSPFSIFLKNSLSPRLFFLICANSTSFSSVVLSPAFMPSGTSPLLNMFMNFLAFALLTSTLVFSIFLWLSSSKESRQESLVPAINFSLNFFSSTFLCMASFSFLLSTSNNFSDRWAFFCTSVSPYSSGSSSSSSSSSDGISSSISANSSATSSPSCSLFSFSIIPYLSEACLLSDSRSSAAFSNMLNLEATSSLSSPSHLPASGAHFTTPSSCTGLLSLTIVSIRRSCFLYLSTMSPSTLYEAKSMFFLQISSVRSVATAFGLKRSL